LSYTENIDSDSKINKLIFFRSDIMSCVQTKIFKNNKSQAVRLPKDIAFPESVKNVEIIVVGNKRIIAPVDQSWDDWFAASGVSSDFMDKRQQPDHQG
jgi:antitoxin VapB